MRALFSPEISRDGGSEGVKTNSKHWFTSSFLQPALVYDILPTATAVFSYAVGSRKLSVNEQFFIGAQTVVSLLKQL